MNKIWPLLLRIYPRSWRVRYEDEFLAMLEQYRPSWLDGLDILFNALEQRIAFCLLRSRLLLRSCFTVPGYLLLRYGMVTGVLFLIGLVLYGLNLFQADLGPQIIINAGVSLLVPIAYCAIEFRLLGKGAWPSVRYGVIGGLVLSMLLVSFSFIVTLINPGDVVYPQLDTILGSILFPAMLLTFVLSSFAATRTSGKVNAGIRAAVWSAFIGMLVWDITNLLFGYIFLDLVKNNSLLYQNYPVSAISCAITCTFQGSLRGILLMGLIAPLAALVSGGLGSGLGVFFRREQPGRDTSTQEQEIPEILAVLV